MSRSKRPGRKPYYPDKKKALTLLSPFAQRVLVAAAERSGRSRADVLEHLIRLHGGAVVFDESSDPVHSEAAT